MACQKLITYHLQCELVTVVLADTMKLWVMVVVMGNKNDNFSDETKTSSIN